jgi:hypothetical protein
MSKYYYQSVGEVVSQTYDVAAETWDDAKRAAIGEMKPGDHLAECGPEAIEEDGYPEYHRINPDKCAEYATLMNGTWATNKAGEEYWEENVYYFDDAPEEYLDASGRPFEAWQ